MLMLLFFAGTAPDVMEHKGQNWENVAAETEVEQALESQSEAKTHAGEHHDAQH